MNTTHESTGSLVGPLNIEGVNAPIYDCTSFYDAITAFLDAWRIAGDVSQQDIERFLALLQSNTVLHPLIAEGLPDIFRAIVDNSAVPNDVMCWPASVVALLDSADKQYGYHRSTDDDTWEVVGVWWNGEVEWVATVNTDTVAQSLVNILRGDVVCVSQQ